MVIAAGLALDHNCSLFHLVEVEELGHDQQSAPDEGTDGQDLDGTLAPNERSGASCDSRNDRLRTAW
jgi:hypothetical protein